LTDAACGHARSSPGILGLVQRKVAMVMVVAFGGALGSLARWGVGEALAGSPDGFPWATFLVNVTGSFALGVLVVLVVARWPGSRFVRPFLGVGVLGGYTTFSAYLADTRALVVADRVPLAPAYVIGTVLVGLLALWLGIALARLAVTGPEPPLPDPGEPL